MYYIIYTDSNNILHVIFSRFSFFTSPYNGREGFKGSLARVPWLLIRSWS